MRSFKNYGIWSQANKQASIYTYMHNTVTLVWGLLRLAQISTPATGSSSILPSLSITLSHVHVHTHTHIHPHAHTACSLVPRPFPPPVFERLQYAKTEGKGLGERVMYVISGRVDVRVDTRGAVPDHKYAVRPRTISSYNA